MLGSRLASAAEVLVKQAALGFRVHSGWTALVAVALEKGELRVLARQRVHLVETFTYQFRQPYHTAEKMPLERASAFISKAESEARRLAEDAVRSFQSDLRKQEYELARIGLLFASGRTLPSLEKILASHALIHTADGELFREALLHASQQCGLSAFTIKERELLDSASQTLRSNPAVLTRRLTALGKPFGAPWSQDEKFATLAAWLALSQRKNS
jgi:hypothetical protein